MACLFVALGFYCFVLGVECLLVEKVELTNRGDSQSVFGRIEEFGSRSGDRTARLGSMEPDVDRRGDDPLFVHHSEAPRGRNTGGRQRGEYGERQIRGLPVVISSLPVFNCKSRLTFLLSLHAEYQNTFSRDRDTLAVIADQLMGRLRHHAAPATAA